MNATFHYALRYFVDIVCQSPLRTGGSARDTKSILTDPYMEPFVQGTSLAGAFRSWQDDQELFSNTDQRSPLSFSDLRLENVEPVLRPRLRIDPKSGTSAGSAKFDMAALPAGTKGSFQLTWTGNADPSEIAPRIEQYLSALHAGEITLGAQRSNGFGRVSITVRRRMYRLENPGDLKAWLKGDQVNDAQLITLSSRIDRSVLFCVTTTVPSILVKGPGAMRGNTQGVQKKGSGSIFTQIEEAGRKIVPGSSLKGSIRSQMSRISPVFHYDSSDLERLFGHENRNKAEGGAAGVLRFSDGALAEAKTVRVPRIRINRLTGGALGTSKFTDEPVRAKLSFEIRCPASHKAGCALLLYALRDLGLGLYELGSGSNVGRGRLSDTRIQITHADARAELHCSPDAVTLTDPDGLVTGWEAELRKGAPL